MPYIIKFCLLFSSFYSAFLTFYFLRQSKWGYMILSGVALIISIILFLLINTKTDLL